MISKIKNEIERLERDKINMRTEKERAVTNYGLQQFNKCLKWAEELEKELIRLNKKNLYGYALNNANDNVKKAFEGEEK